MKYIVLLLPFTFWVSVKAQEKRYAVMNGVLYEVQPLMQNVQGLTDGEAVSLYTTAKQIEHRRIEKRQKTFPVNLLFEEEWEIVTTYSLQ